MHERFGRLLRQSVFGTGLIALTASAAQGQVTAQFFAPFVGGAAPSPTAPFPYGTLVCTVGNLGSSSGFSLDFTAAATQSMLASACGSTAAAQLVHSFGARFTGSLVAPSAGLYDLTFDADDGDVLTINGTTISSQWYDKGSGPGTINATLNAGDNPFVFDYYENTYGGAYATLRLPADLPVTPPSTTTPEPSTWLFVGTGLLGLFGISTRRRRASS